MRCQIIVAAILSNLFSFAAIADSPSDYFGFRGARTGSTGLKGIWVHKVALDRDVTLDRLGIKGVCPQNNEDPQIKFAIYSDSNIGDGPLRLLTSTAAWPLCGNVEVDTAVQVALAAGNYWIATWISDHRINRVSICGPSYIEQGWLAPISTPPFGLNFPRYIYPNELYYRDRQWSPACVYGRIAP